MPTAFPRPLTTQISRQVRRARWLEHHRPQCVFDRQREAFSDRYGAKTRQFSTSTCHNVVKPYLLADIGEGITECQVIQWFVQPGAHVAQFDKICEVQSDKAAVEITSRFDGVIKKLHYEADDMAKVGKPLVDIDIQSEISAEDEALTKPTSKEDVPELKPTPVNPPSDQSQFRAPVSSSKQPAPPSRAGDAQQTTPRTSNHTGDKHRSLATPAVRHMVKEHNLKIEDISGTGKDGRVMKQDVQRHASTLNDNATETQQQTASSSPARSPASLTEDKLVTMTHVQKKMFEAMTRSLSIPHFLYTDTVDFSSLTRIRKSLDKSSNNIVDARSETVKFSALPFIIKAVSLALDQFSSLNAHLDTTGSAPKFTQKSTHNIGIAMDTPSGLLVPVIKNTQSLSIHEISMEITRLSNLARANKLTTSDFAGATFTISNIGSIGGTAVAPVIVGPQVGILGVGRSRVVPAFGENGELVKREECVFSWSADHRVVDGAYVARCAEVVRGYLEGVEGMLVRLR